MLRAVAGNKRNASKDGLTKLYVSYFYLLLPVRARGQINTVALVNRRLTSFYTVED